jgi:hypothetical protein
MSETALPPYVAALFSTDMKNKVIDVYPKRFLDDDLEV